MIAISHAFLALVPKIMSVQIAHPPGNSTLILVYANQDFMKSHKKIVEVHQNIKLKIACHYSCLTCSGGTKIDCDSCNSDNKRSNMISNSCPCEEGYYDN